MSYKDRTYCSSDVEKHTCGRELTEKEKEDADRIKIPVAYGDFCMNPLTTLREGVYKALYEKRDKDALSLDPVQDDVAFVFDETISRTLDLVSEEVEKMKINIDYSAPWGKVERATLQANEYGYELATSEVLSHIQELKDKAGKPT